jgi:hypothetical protein
MRHIEANRLDGLEIDNEIEFGWLFDWEIAGVCALENLVHIGNGKQPSAHRIASTPSRTASQPTVNITRTSSWGWLSHAGAERWLNGLFGRLLGMALLALAFDQR